MQCGALKGRNDVVLEIELYISTYKRYKDRLDVQQATVVLVYSFVARFSIIETCSRAD